MIATMFKRRRRGAYTIEFAVVAPVFFTFILGIIDIGRGIMVRGLLLNAARAGVRVGIIEGKSSNDITTAANNMLNAQGINGDTCTITVNDNAADASTAKAGDEITVTISVPVSDVTWLPFTEYLIGNLTSQYTMARE
jgi:Flp pilus assembly protein TadG